jgi:hypothetical protein
VSACGHACVPIRTHPEWLKVKIDINRKVMFINAHGMLFAFFINNNG